MQATFPSYKTSCKKNGKPHTYPLFCSIVNEVQNQNAPERRHLGAHSPYQLVPKPRMCPPHPQLDRGAKWLAGGNPRQPPFCFDTLPGMHSTATVTVTVNSSDSPALLTMGFHLWYNHVSLSAVMQPRIGHSTVVKQKPGSPSPQVWESMVKMGKKV